MTFAVDGGQLCGHLRGVMDFFKMWFLYFNYVDIIICVSVSDWCNINPCRYSVSANIMSTHKQRNIVNKCETQSG